MPARCKPSKKAPPSPPAVAGDPWAPWIDIAVSIGQAVIACEMMFADAALVTRPAAKRRPLVLAYSSTTIATSPHSPRPRLRSVGAVALLSRDEGKA